MCNNKSDNGLMTNEILENNHLFEDRFLLQFCVLCVKFNAAKCVDLFSLKRVKFMLI